MKGKNRRQGFFHVTPPEVGDYLLKIYAKPEDDIQHESDTLHHVATFQISANHVSFILLNINPYCRYPDGGVGQPGSAAERSGRAVARRAGAQQGRARQPGDGDEGVPQEAAGQSNIERRAFSWLKALTSTFKTLC